MHTVSATAVYHIQMVTGSRILTNVQKKTFVFHRILIISVLGPEAQRHASVLCWIKPLFLGLHLTRQPDLLIALAHLCICKLIATHVLLFHIFCCKDLLLRAKAGIEMVYVSPVWNSL